MKCEGCPHNTFDKKDYSTITFSFLDKDDKEDIGFEPATSPNYYSGDRYERMCIEWKAFIKARKPGLPQLAGLLAQEYLRIEAAV